MAANVQLLHKDMGVSYWSPWAAGVPFGSWSGVVDTRGALSDKNSVRFLKWSFQLFPSCDQLSGFPTEERADITVLTDISDIKVFKHTQTSSENIDMQSSVMGFYGSPTFVDYCCK